MLPSRDIQKDAARIQPENRTQDTDTVLDTDNQREVSKV